MLWLNARTRRISTWRYKCSNFIRHKTTDCTRTRTKVLLQSKKRHNSSRPRTFLRNISREAARAATDDGKIVFTIEGCIIAMELRRKAAGGTFLRCHRRVSEAINYSWPLASFRWRLCTIFQWILLNSFARSLAAYSVKMHIIQVFASLIRCIHCRKCYVFNFTEMFWHIFRFIFSCRKYERLFLWSWDFI